MTPVLTAQGPDAAWRKDAGMPDRDVRQGRVRPLGKRPRRKRIWPAPGGVSLGDTGGDFASPCGAGVFAEDLPGPMASSPEARAPRSHASQFACTRRRYPRSPGAAPRLHTGVDAFAYAGEPRLAGQSRVHGPCSPATGRRTRMGPRLVLGAARVAENKLRGGQSGAIRGPLWEPGHAAAGCCKGILSWKENRRWRAFPDRDHRPHGASGWPWARLKGR